MNIVGSLPRTSLRRNTAGGFSFRRIFGGAETGGGLTGGQLIGGGLTCARLTGGGPALFFVGSPVCKKTSSTTTMSTNNPTTKTAINQPGMRYFIPPS
jgi:hypothetical protein